MSVRVSVTVRISLVSRHRHFLFRKKVHGFSTNLDSAKWDSSKRDSAKWGIAGFISPERTKTRISELKNRNVFWGGGTAHSLDPPPVGREHPSPNPTPRRLWRLDPRAYGARLDSSLRRSTSAPVAPRPQAPPFAPPSHTFWIRPWLMRLRPDTLLGWGGVGPLSVAVLSTLQPCCMLTSHDYDARSSRLSDDVSRFTRHSFAAEPSINFRQEQPVAARVKQHQPVYVPPV